MPGHGDVRLLRTPAELDALAADWSTFEQAAHDPLLTLPWFRAAACTLHAGERLCVIALRRDGRLVGIAPLVESTRHGARHLEFIGSNGLYEPSSLLAADVEALAGLCATIVAQCLPVALLRFAPESRIALAFRAAARGRGLVMDIASPPCLRVDLGAGWQTYLASRTPETRHAVDRKCRRLQAAGSIVFDALRPAPNEVATVLEEVQDVEADGWKGRAGSAMRHNARIRGFVLELARGFAANGDLRVAFLRAGGVAIATCVMLEYDRRLWGIKKGFRESAAAASPGMLLLHECLRDACERGVQAYEFLGSGDRLQPAWATAERRLQSLVYYPYSLRGAWALAVDVLRRFSRRRKRREGALAQPGKE